MRSSRRVGLVLLTLLWTCSASGSLGAGFTGPQPLLPLDELVQRLETGSAEELACAVGQATRLGPDYAWLLADLLRRDDLSGQVDAICKALASNGDEKSLSILREAAVDTTRPWPVRERSLSALAYARDRESLPLLRDLSTNSDNVILSQAARKAILRIESPGRFRPLVEVEEGRVYFGFLLDDIESIEYTEPPDVAYSFAPEKFRTVCDLLQAGSIVDARDMPAIGVLTFKLKDGAEVPIHTDGKTYGWISGHFVESPGLGELIWRGLGRDHEGAEPHN